MPPREGKLLEASNSTAVTLCLVCREKSIVGLLAASGARVMCANRSFGREGADTRYGRGRSGGCKALTMYMLCYISLSMHM